MTYNVFGWTLSLNQSITVSLEAAKLLTDPSHDYRFSLGVLLRRLLGRKFPLNLTTLM